MVIIPSKSTQDPFQTDERWLLTQRVLASGLFQRSPRLGAFLLYVCENTLRGLPDNVREQQIGQNVFGRRADYNMGEDSIVRVEARELRKRLTLYFSAEGKDEPLVIRIPKGGYLPHFVPQEPAPLERIPVQSNEIVRGPGLLASLAELPRHKLLYALIVGGGILLLSIGALLGALLSSRSRTAPLEASQFRKAYPFYEQMLGPLGLPGKDTLVVLSNPRLPLYSGPLDQKFTPGSPGLAPLSGPVNVVGAKNSPSYVGTFNDTFTGIGEAACAYNLGRLMLNLNRNSRLTESRFLNWEVATQTHLIILGDWDPNRWTHDNRFDPNFTFSTSGILNARPQLGEQAVYPSEHDKNGHATDDYAIIRMSTTVTSSKVMLLAGHEVSGTNGAGQFFTDPAKMKSAFDKISQIDRTKPFPENWEILLHISVRDNIPVDTSLVSVRASYPTK